MRKKFSTIIGVAVPVVIAAIGLLSTLLIILLLHSGSIPLWHISQNDEINFTFTMQMIVLANSFIVLGCMYLYNRQRFKMFFRFGRIKDWALYGSGIAIAFTAGTTMMMSFSVVAQHGSFNQSFFKLLPLVILFSATNAWSEEILSRFVIVAGLYEKLPPLTICSISALLFGLAHYGGTPGGIFGIIAAGFMGGLLAKSVIDTKGMGWALFIHFLQDMVIFGSGAMVIAAQH